MTALTYRFGTAPAVQTRALDARHVPQNVEVLDEASGPLQTKGFPEVECT